MTIQWIPVPNSFCTGIHFSWTPHSMEPTELTRSDDRSCLQAQQKDENYLVANLMTEVMKQVRRLKRGGYFRIAKTHSALRLLRSCWTPNAGLRTLDSELFCAPVNFKDTRWCNNDFSVLQFLLNPPARRSEYIGWRKASGRFVTHNLYSNL